MSERVKVAGAVFVRNGLVMATQRNRHKKLGGLWEFPGGKIEPGETAKEALAREIREELQCTAIIGEHLVTADHDYPFGQMTLTTFLCELGDEEPVLTEHEAIRWCTPDELASLDWAPADLPTINLLIERMGS